MAKRRGKKQQKALPKKPVVPFEETSSSPLPHPNRTPTSDTQLQVFDATTWLSRDSTKAPIIGEVTEDKEEYAESHAALIDKYLLSRQSIPLVFALIVIGYVFIQDNGAEKLTNWQGIWWTIQKSGILLGIFLVILLIDYVYKRLSGS